MPSELSNYSSVSTGGAAPSSWVGEVEGSGQLVVVTFDDASQAESLYAELKELDKQKVIYLEDAVFVSKNEDGEFKVDEKVHHEKRTGMLKGAALGTLIGLMLGGPILGLAGGAVAGRLIGKRVDLGVDKGTIQSVADDLEQGHTALFIIGSARHAPTVIDVFKKYKGKIVQTTVDDATKARLQNALDADNEG